MGLDQLTNAGWTLPRAVSSRKWPGTASLEVAHIWLRYADWHGPYLLDEQHVTHITSFMDSSTILLGKPYTLSSNANKSFQGSVVLGIGFVLAIEEAQALIAKDPRNKDVLFPYLNGEDLNSRPDQSPRRQVINFHNWPLEQAETYRDCIEIVKERVKPERNKSNRKIYREKWWQYAEKCQNLYNTIEDMKRVLVISFVTAHLAPAFCPVWVGLCA